ncbi:MAG: hypothetical protein FWG28_06755 [Clostridiales bacterium]|nr:hypothetical protein [Clostridiales bacterium]
MFASSRPPLLVLLIPVQQLSLFPQSEGYDTHYFSADHVLISYQDGWYFPLSVLQQKFVTAPPMLLVRSKGRLTTEGGTFRKGYAHQFCGENGGEPESLYQREIFDDKPGVKWLLVEDSATMIWLQYGDKSQYLGESGSDIERIYYGKLIIRKFTIESDYEPKLDKNADHTSLCAKLYRVGSTDHCIRDWSVEDRAPEEYLQEVLAEMGIERFMPSVRAALNQAKKPQ